ncbi:STM4015 family protein [Streptomyces sp. NBC_01716]|uniref:STM4015 family protein n=1 Tax=Streptomyces sp. NBC_01716 TaxID=2975917 RepID=UPI002E35310A|nr:STM4015 family protein [Streptomyces sp. NBC_01716]
MDIEHFDEFHGLPVFTLPHHKIRSLKALPEAEAVAWRLDCGWEEEWTFPELWKHFTDAVDTERVRALVIGPWWSGDYSELAPALELIVADAARFPALRALFLGDVVGEECEVSWLVMTDVTPAIEAFPSLEEFAVRGCGDTYQNGAVRLRPVQHERLRLLRFESGGLRGSVVRAVGESELPALERLELWLGIEEYGGDATVADLAPLLDGGRFPLLRHLGLRNSEIQDEIAGAVASAPVVAGLESLALSMGTLADPGGEALLAGQPLTHLKTLDLRHHFMSPDVTDRIQQTLGPHGVRVELEPPYDLSADDEWRYVAVSE